MVAILKKGATAEHIQKLLKNLTKKNSSKGVNTLKFCGKITLNEDALVIQKNLRDEW